MTDKTNSAFSQEQRTQISNACERVQDAININNSTFAQLNADLVRKADEIAIKWRAYGLPYNAICDAVLEMAMWQKEQSTKLLKTIYSDCDNLKKDLDRVTTGNLPHRIGNIKFSITGIQVIIKQAMEDEQ